MSIILYMLVTPALYYLGSRAMLTAPLWTRYPARFSLFMDCSACSGTWYGALVGTFGGYYLGLPFLGLDGDNPVTIGLVALCSMTWTPIVAAFMQWAFEMLGSAAPVANEPETRTSQDREPEPRAREPEPPGPGSLRSVPYQGSE